VSFNSGLTTSKTDEWETPWELFNELDNEFTFDLDPCASIENAKCCTFFDKELDGLSRSWGGHTVFMNPPYGREIDATRAAYAADAADAKMRTKTLLYGIKMLKV